MNLATTSCSPGNASAQLWTTKMRQCGHTDFGLTHSLCAGSSCLQLPQAGGGQVLQQGPRVPPGPCPPHTFPPARQPPAVSGVPKVFSFARKISLHRKENFPFIWHLKVFFIRYVPIPAEYPHISLWKLLLHFTCEKYVPQISKQNYWHHLQKTN